MKKIVLLCAFLFSSLLSYATSGELAQLSQLELRIRTIMKIIDQRKKSVSDNWWIDTSYMNLGPDLIFKTKTKGPIAVQDLIEGLANAHNERYSQAWFLSKRARECCQHILDAIEHARRALACRVENPAPYTPHLMEKIKALESLKSRINTILFMLRDTSSLGRTLYHGNWNLPSPEIVGTDIPHATRIAWSIITYNMMPKTIAVRPILELMLEQLKLISTRTIRELKKNN